jgi:hypothetical protein
MEIFIDKIEDKIAELHLEDEQILYINIKDLPLGIKEGDYLDLEFILNNNKKEDVKKKIDKLIDELSSNSEGGDFEI